MAEPTPERPAANSPGPVRRLVGRWLSLRHPAPSWVLVLLGLLCIVGVLGLWWLVTRGEAEQRVVSPSVLPSVEETFSSFPNLWFERALARNLVITLRRVVLGFLFAAAVGIPLGVLAGCFTRMEAFLSPLIIFGRNIPIAALTMLTFFIFGIGEIQKVMFIFIACVAFIVADSTQALKDVGQRYVDTAYTLGAGRWQTIAKVLVPLAMPSIFNSLRVLFGLAFGYIMLAELVKLGDEEGGLGYLILVSQRRNLKEHIYLIVLIIPLVAFAIDRLLYFVQRGLFPHRYGGPGFLARGVRGLFHGWEFVVRLFWRPDLAPLRAPQVAGATANSPTGGELPERPP